MKGNKAITFFGVLFILLWTSKIPYLFPHPFQPNQGVKYLSKEAVEIPEFIKQQGGIGGKTQIEIENFCPKSFESIGLNQLF